MFIIDSSNFYDIFGVLAASTAHWVLKSAQSISWPQLGNSSSWGYFDKTVCKLKLIFAFDTHLLLFLGRVCSTCRQCGQVLVVLVVAIHHTLLLAKFGGFYWRIWANWHAIQILVRICFGASSWQTQPPCGLFGRIFAFVSLVFRYHRFVIHDRQVVQFVERAFGSKLQRRRSWRNSIFMLLSCVSESFIRTRVFFKMRRLLSNLRWSTICGASFAFRVHFHDSLSRGATPLPRLLIVIIIILVDLIGDEVLSFGDQSIAQIICVSSGWLRFMPRFNASLTVERFSWMVVRKRTPNAIIVVRGRLILGARLLIPL